MSWEAVELSCGAAMQVAPATSRPCWCPVHGWRSEREGGVQMERGRRILATGRQKWVQSMSSQSLYSGEPATLRLQEEGTGSGVGGMPATRELQGEV